MLRSYRLVLLLLGVSNVLVLAYHQLLGLLVYRVHRLRLSVAPLTTGTK